MRLFLFPETLGVQFFSYTQAVDKISMILEEESINLFPPWTLSVAKEPWHALSVMFGSVGTGLVSGISQIFADSLIPLFYISTAHTDFILVREHDLDRALATLKQSYHMIREDTQSPACSWHDNESLSITNQGGEIDPTVLQQKVISVVSDEPLKRFVPTPNLEWTIFDNLNLHISSLQKENRVECAHTLLQILFFSEGKFFSFTETYDEISLLVEKDAFGLFIDDVLCQNDEWVPIERFKKKNLSEIGVIASISQPLAQAKIPMLYLSTLHSSFIMVRSSDVQQTRLWLESNKYSFIRYTDKVIRDESEKHDRPEKAISNTEDNNIKEKNDTPKVETP